MPDPAGANGDRVGEIAARLRGGANPRRAERAHLGAAIRRLIAAAVSTDAGDAELADATATLDRVTDALGATATRWPPGDGLGAAPGDDMFVTHPLLGAANPLAPPLRVEATGGGVVGQVTYGPAYEGLPGKVYGGVIATAFDGMAIFAAVAGGHHGVTGSLDLRFRRPTPIGVEVTYEAELVRIEGRRGFVDARLVDPDGAVCVEAEGAIVTPRHDVLSR